VKKFAGQTQVGEWLREQSAESVAALRQLLHELVAWVWQQLLHAGQRQVFLDDTQLEVSGKKFEVAALIANQIYHLIAALAYNLMVAIKLLDLSDECQAWRVKTLLKKLVMLPGRLSQRSRQWVPGGAGARSVVELVAALGAAGVDGTRTGTSATGGGRRCKNGLFLT